MIEVQIVDNDQHVFADEDTLAVPHIMLHTWIPLTWNVDFDRLMKYNIYAFWVFHKNPHILHDFRLVNTSNKSDQNNL